MGPELIDVNKHELTFVFELKKQSSDSVQLSNNSDQYIAFKVKTTSPKKYCVRPNIGIIKPKSTCVFIVTMQAQKEAPPYMQSKDKFLVQSTIVPYGTKEEDISSEVFAKNSEKYIEEKKLRVVLISPSPGSIPSNGNSEHRSSTEIPKHGDQYPSGLNTPLSELIYKVDDPKYPTDIKTSVLKLEEVVKGFTKSKNGVTSTGTKIDEPTHEPRNMNTTVVKETVNANYLQAAIEDKKGRPSSYQNAESKVLKDLWTEPQSKALKELLSNPQKVEAKPSVDVSVKHNTQLVHNINVEEPKIEKSGMVMSSENDFEALKSKLISLNTQLNESEKTVTRLEEEQSKAIKEIKMLKQELALFKQGTSSNEGKVYDGFPLLFVVMIALVSIMCGYLLRA